MTTKKRGAGRGTGATTHSHHHDADTSNDIPLELWEALFNGELRLAVKCTACGRYLTANASRKAHIGPKCAARAVA